MKKTNTINLTFKSNHVLDIIVSVILSEPTQLIGTIKLFENDGSIFILNASTGETYFTKDGACTGIFSSELLEHLCHQYAVKKNKNISFNMPYNKAFKGVLNSDSWELSNVEAVSTISKSFA